MFHQNLMLWKSKSPVISWITGFYFLGCPDGLEPSTFRTTSNLSNSPIVPLFIDVCDFIENRVCVDFASISAPVIIFKILFQRTLVLLLENFLQFAFIRSF